MAKRRMVSRSFATKWLHPIGTGVARYDAMTSLTIGQTHSNEKLRVRVASMSPKETSTMTDARTFGTDG